MVWPILQVNQQALDIIDMNFMSNLGDNAW